MKKRFSKMGKSLLGAMCLLSTCGLTYSCSDDYDLDETMPSFLGGSIYDELKARNFTTVVRLADDLGYANVLSRTGSKTLFVADDEAYRKFFSHTCVKNRFSGHCPYGKRRTTSGVTIKFGKYHTVNSDLLIEGSW